MITSKSVHSRKKRNEWTWMKHRDEEAAHPKPGGGLRGSRASPREVTRNQTTQGLDAGEIRNLISARADGSRSQGRT